MYNHTIFFLHDNNPLPDNYLYYFLRNSTWIIIKWKRDSKGIINSKMLSLLFKWDNADNDYFIRDIPVHELLRPHIIFSINHVDAFNIHTDMNQQKKNYCLTSVFWTKLQLFSVTNINLFGYTNTMLLVLNFPFCRLLFY